MRSSPPGTLNLATYKFRLLLLALLALLLGYPYANPDPDRVGLFTVLSELVFASAVFATAERRFQLVTGLGLLAVVILTDWAPRELLGPLGQHARLIAGAAYFPFATLVIGLNVFRSTQTTADSLAGAVCVYLLLALAFASWYLPLEIWQPGSVRFSASEPIDLRVMLHFSFTALTTVGYGAITPATPAARSLADLESALGVLYTAILVARLVGSYLSASRTPSE